MKIVLRIFIVIVSFLFIGCEEDQDFAETIEGTWKLEWKRCEIYHNDFESVLKFSFTDSTQNGWVTQQEDTTYFDFVLSSNQSIEIVNATNNSWNGIMKFTRVSERYISFEREQKGCENELFQYKK